MIQGFKVAGFEIHVTLKANESEGKFVNMKLREQAVEAGVTGALMKLKIDVPDGVLPVVEPTDYEKVTLLSHKYKVPIKAGDYWRCLGRFKTAKLDGERWLVSEAEFKKEVPIILKWRADLDEQKGKGTPPASV